MSVHELKCWPMFFKRVIDGSKDWEFRPDDRDYKIGDELVLVEFDPTQNRPTQFTGAVCKVIVREIVRDGKFIAMRIAR